MRSAKYAEFREVHAGWYRSAPVGWGALPCRAVFEEQTRKNDPLLSENYLSLMANVGVVLYADKGDVGNKKPDDLTKCKLVKAGDFVINSMNFGIGSYGESPYDGVCSPVYVVLSPKRGPVHKRFAFRVLESKAFQTYAQSFGNGILEHRSAIGWDVLKGISIPVPPLQEQIAILDFLDTEIARIDLVIRKQRELIALLNESRDLAISRAVVGLSGADEARAFRKSKWLPDLPVGWQSIRLRRLLRSVEQGWSPNALPVPAQGNEFGVIKLSAVKRGRFNAMENKALDEQIVPPPELLIQPGDFLLTRANTPDLVGDCCVVPGGAQPNLMLSDLVYRLALKPAITPAFLSFFLQSRFGRDQIRADARGSSMSMAKISQGHIKDWLVAVPPSDVQAEIVSQLDELVREISSTQDKCHRAIDLLLEERDALITAAVTGAIRVPSYASAPDETVHELAEVIR